MKKIGDQAKEFRLNQGWNTTEMGIAVGTSRQNIESLEARGNRTPRYLVKLAKVMGVTTDALHKGEYSADKKADADVASLGQELGNTAPTAAISPPVSKPLITASAIELAAIYDMIPIEHRLLRAEAFSLATTAIAEVLRRSQAIRRDPPESEKPNV
jgi:transcriptional regulator with XRE-family HTH domain